LIDYYRRIASWILLHLRGRPLAMERFPDGTYGEGAAEELQQTVFMNLLGDIGSAVSM